MFIDKARIIVSSGKGGDGHVSFRREKYVPAGGPDGGDGGKGGDVIFVVDEGLNTLTDFRHVRKYAAQHGEDGKKKRMAGKKGQDIEIKVPEGTVIREAKTGKKWNEAAQPGQPSRSLELLLELKMIADVGLVGFPNVGKSTLLSMSSNAKPRIANYHFTTLQPILGVVDLEDARGFVMADIPGLIEGAADGAGLGHEFLAHLERTRILIHVVDAAGSEGRDPIEDIMAINRELARYKIDLSSRRQIIAANKCDLIPDEEYREEGEKNPLDEISSPTSRSMTPNWNWRKRPSPTPSHTTPRQRNILWKDPGSSACSATPIWRQKKVLFSSRSLWWTTASSTNSSAWAARRAIRCVSTATASSSLTDNRQY